MLKPYRLAAAALLGLSAASPTLASMTVAEFLGTVDGLKAKGPFALFSSDIGKLKRAGKEAVIAWYDQATPPGRPRNACPPPKDKLDLTDKAFMTMLEAVPPAQRAHTSVSQVVTAHLNRRYPCSA